MWTRNEMTENEFVLFSISSHFHFFRLFLLEQGAILTKSPPERSVQLQFENPLYNFHPLLTGQQQTSTQPISPPFVPPNSHSFIQFVHRSHIESPSFRWVNWKIDRKQRKMLKNIGKNQIRIGHYNNLITTRRKWRPGRMEKGKKMKMMRKKKGKTSKHRQK